jgi:hypothetical protein
MSLKEKAFDKAYAKVTTLSFELNKTLNDINGGGVGGIDLDQLIGIKEHLESEIEVWSYILTLIEKNDRL